LEHAHIKLSPDVERILTRAAIFYGGLQSFEVDIDSFYHRVTTNTRHDTESTFHLALKQPDEFSMVIKTGVDGYTEVSDGTRLITYQPYNNTYASSADPASLEDIVTPFNLGFIASGDPLGYESFLPKNFIEVFEAMLVKCEYLGVEEVGTLPAEHVRLTTEGEAATDYWIATGNRPLLLKSQFSLDASKFIKGMPDAVVNRLSSEMRSEKRTRTTIYSNWQINQPVSETAFQYQPPGGARQVTGVFPCLVHPLVGRMAPDFQLNDLQGMPVRLSDLRGKIVVLDFWSIKCPPCVAGLPILAKITSDREAEGVVFYAINSPDSTDAIKTFLKNKGLSFLTLLDPNELVRKLFHVDGIPVTFVVDKSGKIQSVDLGYNLERESKLSDKLDTLLAGKSLLSGSDKNGK